MDINTKRGYDLISRRRRQWANEEEVRHAWMKGLEEALQIDLDAERAQRDSSYNNVVIEFKGPGLFKGSVSSPKFKEATEGRLLKYIQRLAAEQGLDEKDYIGIAIDGNHVGFVQVEGGKIIHQPLMPFSTITFQMVVDALRANFRRSITSENLVEDFGHLSTTGREFMQELSNALADALGQPGNRKIKMLFEEWATLYGQVADLSIQQRKKVNGSLGFDFNGPSYIDMPAKLFVTHTFHSLLMKLIAAEIVAAHGMASSTSLIHELLAIDKDEALVAALRADVENGGFFNAVGLHGFVEEAIFSWYLDAASKKEIRTSLCMAIRTLLAKLSVYRFDTIKRTGRSRDVLRDFYQDLVPEELRKSLGEFYTPDWLVEHAVAKLGYNDDKWLVARLLDPTCGSGSFLLEVIEQKRRAALAVGWSAGRTVDMLTTTVWGFDLNPLAVQSSRVNFLIAIADLLQQCKGKDVEIPVLLADTVYSPAPHPDGDQKVIEYSIGSEHANLKVVLPAELARDRALLDRVFQIMGTEVENDVEYSAVANALMKSGVLTKVQNDEWHDYLKETYDQVLALHRQNWNGIWFRIVRNFFWSATAGRFDAIVGNPPWVRWSNLPEAYRNRAKPTCEKYAIFSDTKFHGGNELDISAIITYTTADKWLVEDGKLVFVITQTLFQSPSSQGFRRFRINATDRLVPLSIDDMKALKPFPDAANKTSVAMFTKKINGVATYPLDYRVWLGKPKSDNAGNPKKGRGGQPQRLKAIAPRLHLQDVLGLVDVVQMEANPVSDTMEGAPWAVMRPGRFAACKPLFGASTWVNGRKGITTDLNGVYFVEVIDSNAADKTVKVRTRPQEGKTDIGRPRDFWVEAESLYPLAKGAGDLHPCYFLPENNLYAFVPNKGIDRASLDAAAACYNTNTNPKTFGFFKAYKHLLESRSTFKTRMKGAPFFAIYNVGDYTFAPYKVIWAEMTGDFAAAVVTSGTVPGYGPRVYVPDHKLYFADFKEPEPAYFLCGLLHSDIVKEMIEAHNVATNIGDIFKHISLPHFDPLRPDHIALANLVKQAHGEHDSTRRAHTVAKVRNAADTLIEAEIRWRTQSVC
ncbi:MAG: SAM-dependent methyltransferase [Azospira oryzae]|nr:MAG: SAM-dependent methyltransferase [Azospira oryzae]PZP81243.1 MAG: SAM-dependent methyltransferase [Azospira oryzae]